MKHTIWLLITLILFSQGGCAFGPSIDETSREGMKTDRAVEESDAFARSLPP